MFAWIKQHLPGSPKTQTILLAILIAVIVAALIFGLYPAIYHWREASVGIN